MPKYFNPADFLLDIVSIDYRPEYLEQTRKQVDNIIKYWAENGGNGTSSKEKAAGSGQTSGGEEPTARSPNRLTPMWVAGPVVLERTLRNM